MLKGSQPLDPKFCKKYDLDDSREHEAFSEKKIKLQRIGKMFDHLFDDSRERKISLRTRLGWKRRRINDKIYDLKYAARNRKKWRKTINELRPWLGYDGLILVMQTHLSDYVETEEKYGHSLEEYKKHKIATVRETIELLDRMKEPDEYPHRRREEVEAKYPEYKYLITEYESGGTSFSGDFVAFKDGWVGIESGKDPREGYFEFVEGRFELKDSPDQGETDRLLAEVHKYHEEITAAYKQAEVDSDEDFERLGQLLKENLYSWWD